MGKRLLKRFYWAAFKFFFDRYMKVADLGGPSLKETQERKANEANIARRARNAGN